MKTSRAFLLSVVSFIIWLSPISLLASGGSTTSFRPATNDAYNLGKAIYTGQYKVREEVDPHLAEKQTKKLEWLQSKLPADQQKVIYLPEFAGRLTENQLNALEVFIAKRFKVDTSNYQE